MVCDEKFQKNLFERYRNEEAVEDLNALIWNSNKDMVERKHTLFTKPVFNLLGTDGGADFRSDLDSFWIRVFTTMDQFFDYLAGQFRSNDDLFQAVLKRIMKHAYLGGVYIGYGIEFLNRELEKANSAENKEKIKLEYLTESWPWRVYVKDNNSNTFKSLLSNVKDIDLGELRYEYFSIYDDGMPRFIELFTLCKENVASYYYNQELISLACKRAVFMSEDPSLINKMKKEFSNKSSFFIINETNNPTVVTPVEFLSEEGPSTLYKAMKSRINERWSDLGMIKTTEDRSERLTSGEHIKQLKTPINVLSMMEGLLKGLFRRCSKTFGINIELIPSNFITTIDGGEEMHWTEGKGNNMME